MRAVIVQTGTSIQAVSVVNTRDESEQAVQRIRDQIAAYEAVAGPSDYTVRETAVDALTVVERHCIPSPEDA